MPDLHLSLGSRWNETLSLASLWHAHVEQREREHEKRNEFGPLRHASNSVPDPLLAHISDEILNRWFTRSTCGPVRRLHSWNCKLLIAGRCDWWTWSGSNFPYSNKICKLLIINTNKLQEFQGLPGSLHKVCTKLVVRTSQLYRSQSLLLSHRIHYSGTCSTRTHLN
jgi:hypothetical protein